MSNVDGSWQGVLSFGGQVYLIDMPAEHSTREGVARSQVMSAEPSSSFPPVACGHPNHRHNEPQSSRALVNLDVHSALQIPQQVAFSSLCQTTIDDGAGGQVCLLAEMEFAFDEAFQSEFGANARAQAESLINMVEGFYRNDFGIIFDTLTLELVDDSVFDTTILTGNDVDSGAFLDDVQERKRNGQLPFIQNSQALLHVVTGLNFEGSTAGVAFVDALCNRFGFGAGTSQVLRRFNGDANLPLTALVVAHEVGHNFGANHDGDGNSCSDSGFIMAASVSSSASEFSSCSQDTMEAAISAVSTPENCFNFPADLSIVAASGNPTSATAGVELNLEYTVSSQDAFRSLSALMASGSVPANEGRFNSVELNGQSCTVASDGLSYTCTANNPAASMTLLVRVVANQDNVQFSHQVAVSGDDEIVDINSGNNEQQTALAVTAAATVPAAPGSLSASQGSGNNVTLSWTDNSNNEDNFRIERRIGAGSFATLSTVAANITSFTDATSVASTSYGYRVIAVNSVGDSAVSNEATITTPTPAPTPTPTPTPAPSGGGGGATGWLLVFMGSLLLFRERRVF
ncbi:M12 family metallo-peptidase [Porticoccus sp. W117]|uniref:M12 family metallo-peptidase n=1 Tax=Porticoccus sp. W117 TaxID=3054777 RepID=UPI002598A24C|nr:M12 family metallo-peptidase [Porticoccus sp. W117]MDM3871310.1 M12 family metallo-peptidase [Porticoccus sp. W117]